MMNMHLRLRVSMVKMKYGIYLTASPEQACIADLRERQPRKRYVTELPIIQSLRFLMKLRSRKVM